MVKEKKPLALGINGSPRKNGTVSRMLKNTLQEIEKRGGKTETVYLAATRILPHTGKLDDKIFIEDTDDDMPRLQELVLKADGIIFATPTYWFNVSSLMKLFLDRLTSLEHYKFLLEGKVGGIISYGPEGGALNSAMQILMFASQNGMIVPPYCAIFDEGRKDAWLKDAYKLMAKNILLQIQAGKKLQLNWDFPDSKYKTSPIELLKKKKS